MSSFAGKIQTVLGSIDSMVLKGPTLMHEHVFVDVRHPFFRPPSDEAGRSMVSAPFTLENRFWIEYNHSSHLDNLHLESTEEAIEELSLFKSLGGHALVELTTRGIHPRPQRLRHVSQATGLHIIMGTGYYVQKTHPEDFDGVHVNDVVSQLVHDLTVGCEAPEFDSKQTTEPTRIKAGIIGELGCSYPLHPGEAKVLRAAAVAQRQTGVAISLHPGRNRESPFEIIDVLRDAGADLSRCIMGHIDRTLQSPSDLLRLAETGVVVEFDLFGVEVSKYWFNESVDMPSDGQRLDLLMTLVEHGYGQNLVISHDIYSKHRLRRYGGHSYDHILRNIVPRMRLRGFSEEIINSILIDTPRRLLTQI